MEKRLFLVPDKRAVEAALQAEEHELFASFVSVARELWRKYPELIESKRFPRWLGKEPRTALDLPPRLRVKQ